MDPLSLLQRAKLSVQLATEFKEMTLRPYWSRDRLEAYQLARLREILREARTRVPMYASRALPEPEDIRQLADWSRLPILTKQDLLSVPAQERVSARYPFADLIVSKSSGSTGQALDVFYDSLSYNHFILAGLRLYLMAFRYLPWHKQTYIYTSPYPIDSFFGLYPLEFIETLNPIPDTIARLKANPPDLLVCYPSHLRAIASQMTSADLEKVRPKAINVNSEMSSQAERDYLSELFGCFVFDDYSSEELTRIASQCRHYNYHVFDDINYIEIVDDDGRPVPEGTVGNIVGTNLHNMGMPLIRYQQGDKGAIRTKPCGCGRTFRVLEKLEGRRNDAFTLSTGETVSSGYLLDLTYGVFLKYPNAVSAFCLVQDEPDNWALELVPGHHWCEGLDSRITAELERSLKRPGVRILGRIVSDVRKTKSGKANPIISNLNRQVR